LLVPFRSEQSLGHHRPAEYSRQSKDLIAKTLHYESMRQAEPFISINCAAIPETLLESEWKARGVGPFSPRGKRPVE
jgi:transcriptional regulator of aromatic amino acid metabolism